MWRWNPVANKVSRQITHIAAPKIRCKGVGYSHSFFFATNCTTDAKPEWYSHSMTSSSTSRERINSQFRKSSSKSKSLQVNLDLWDRRYLWRFEISNTPQARIALQALGFVPPDGAVVVEYYLGDGRKWTRLNRCSFQAGRTSQGRQPEFERQLLSIELGLWLLRVRPQIHRLPAPPIPGMPQRRHFFLRLLLG